MSNIEREASGSHARARFDVIVIGGGQAGLSVGHHLQRHELRFLILDAAPRIGDTWRARWDSLRLFTPARYDGLDGLPFPAPPESFPTKDQMADYLEAYAARFELPVLSGVRVDRLSREEGRFVVRAGNRVFEADQVVVAMSSFQRGKRPAFARELAADVVQLHSSDYHGPGQLRPGGVLIVGAGNSGAEIAMELARAHRVYLSGPDTGHVPFRIEGFWGRKLLVHVVLRFVFHVLLTIWTPVGRKVRRNAIKGGGPLVRVKPRDLSDGGVERVGRTVAVHDGHPQLDDGRVLDVANVVWCSGYTPAFSWIDLPVFDGDGQPRHEAGAVVDVPGLFFVGLHFLTAMSSGMIHGVGRDARRIAALVAGRSVAPDAAGLGAAPLTNLRADGARQRLEPEVAAESEPLR